MKTRNSDFWILAAIVSAVGVVGVYEGNELHAAFYSQPAILFSGLGYFAYKAFYFDHSPAENHGTVKS